MNIKEAKVEIKNALDAYLTRDEMGEYLIPIVKQRPLFLMGPPGIGKTAIMEQISQELNVGLISYSMTHHTRQSALGLPLITKKMYDGKEYDITEYTMSEIIAAVYEYMEETGVKEGILFLDEINCVSETLAPVMLQFLQYKVFGKHQIPKGWIVVAAGNPPEFNNSVRDFDIVTWDRLKRIDIQPEYKVWKEYAINKGVHAAILTYLDIKTDDFYTIETTVEGKAFITARGWTDLSAMISLYEDKSFSVKETLIQQYIQKKRIAMDFSVYYDLFIKHRKDYQIDKILEGTADEALIKRAKLARFDERLILIGLLLEKVYKRTAIVNKEEELLKQLVKVLREIKKDLSKAPVDLYKLLDKKIKKIEEKRLKDKASRIATSEDQNILSNVQNLLIEYKHNLPITSNREPLEVFEEIKKPYDARLKKLRDKSGSVSKEIDNIFVFIERAFGEGQELLVIITDLMVHKDCAHFISRHGSKKYFQYNKEMLFYERNKGLMEEVENLS